MYERSIKDPAGFWSEVAETFYWKEKWNPSEVCSENLDVTKGTVHISVSVIQCLLTKFSTTL
jgi:acetyl-CoA synthetase